MVVHPIGGECKADAMADGGTLGNFLYAGLFISSANRFSSQLEPHSLIFVLFCVLAGFNGDKLEDNDRDKEQNREENSRGIRRIENMLIFILYIFWG